MAMTANALKGDRKKCIDAGMDDYLTKPVKFDDLNRMIEKWRPSFPYKEQNKHQETPVSGTDSNKTFIEPIDIVEAMEMAMDDKDFLQGLFREFIDRIPEIIDIIKSAIEENDSEKLKKMAHQLKGSAGNMRAIQLSAIAHEIELLDDLEDQDKALSFLENLKAEAETGFSFC